MTEKRKEMICFVALKPVSHENLARASQALEGGKKFGQFERGFSESVRIEEEFSSLGDISNLAF